MPEVSDFLSKYGISCRLGGFYTISRAVNKRQETWHRPGKSNSKHLQLKTELKEHSLRETLVLQQLKSQLKQYSLRQIVLLLQLKSELKHCDKITYYRYR